MKQCRPLTHDPRLPAVVTQLLGDDESKKIAGQIQKILVRSLVFCPPSSRVTLSDASKSPRMVIAFTIIITVIIVGVSTPLVVIIVAKLGTELPIVSHLSVRNIVFLDRLIQ